MLKDLPSLERLIRHLQNIPYLASKNIYRVATYFLESDPKQIEQLCTILLESRKNIKKCSICFSFTEEKEACNLCSSTKRNKSLVCVVETWHDFYAIEKSGGYEGLYHILGGALCPLEGLGPDQLTIKPLLKRIDEFQIKEIIFATNPTPEGEATAAFIASKLKEKPIEISKLASGVPIGSVLSHMDRITIFKALSGRRPF